MVGTGRFELPTCRLGGDRSIHLSYVPANPKYTNRGDLRPVIVGGESMARLKQTADFVLLRVQGKLILKILAPLPIAA